MTQLERLIGACAALLALFGLAALDPKADSWLALGSLGLLGAQGLTVAALAGQPRLHAMMTERGRTIRHALDGVLILALLASTGGASSYFFTYLLYPVLAGVVRWGVRGAYWTALGVVVAYALLVGASILNPAPDLSYRYFAVRLVILTTAAGVLGLAASRLRRLPAEAGDDEAALALVLDGLADGVLLVNEGGIVRAANAPAARMFGTTPGELRGMAVQRLASSVDPTRGQGVLDAVTDGNPRQRVVWEIAALRPDGTTFPCELTVSALRLDGRPAYVGILRDVSKRREAEAAARRELEAAVAEEERIRIVEELHDGLLQTLTGAGLQLKTVEGLMEKEPGEALRRLAQARQALAAEQRELRFWASEVKPIVLQDDSDHLENRLLGTLERIGATWNVATDLHYSLPQDLPAPLAQQVYRLVQESAVNAVRHGEASRVAVEVLPAPAAGGRDGVLIRVSDNGRGFPFQGFLSDQELEARGLGPVILKHRVRRVNGTLAIDSSPSGARLDILISTGGAS